MLDISNKQVLIMGLGRFGGGVGAARFAAEHGANVTVTDMNSADKLQDSINQLSDLDITFHLGEHIEDDFKSADLIIVNPAVPQDNEYLTIARNSNVALTTEMNLFCQNCPAPIVGITGSNGKSTTTAMTHHILSKCLPDKTVWLGGNIGKGSLLAKIDQVTASDIVVLELSSFQLEDLAQLQISPHIAIVTNIAPNHLDRHGTMENYIAAKQNILKFQTESDFAIICGEDPQLDKWMNTGLAQKQRYEAIDIKLKVPGRHNKLNAAAALAVADKFKIKVADAKLALDDFYGLEHRLEFVTEINGAKYYNDSISTTPESTIVAIDAFSRPKIMILGGYDKKLPFKEMANKIAGNVKTAILIGQTADIIAADIEQAKIDSDCLLPQIFKCETFEDAINTAKEAAVKGDIVLLSPACASYGMFENFQQRGNIFKHILTQKY